MTGWRRNVLAKHHEDLSALDLIGRGRSLASEFVSEHAVHRHTARDWAAAAEPVPSVQVGSILMLRERRIHLITSSSGRRQCSFYIVSS